MREHLECFRLLAVLQDCRADEHVTRQRASERNARGRRCNGFAHAAILRPRDCWKSKEHGALAGLITNFPFNHLPHQTKENIAQSVTLYILSGKVTLCRDVQNICKNLCYRAIYALFCDHNSMCIPL